MTTNVSFFMPYIMSGKVVRVSQRSPSTGKLIGVEQIITDANKLNTLVIHDGAMLLIEEVNAPPVVLPADPAPGVSVDSILPPAAEQPATGA